jgi:hypothetical protein
MRHVLAAWKLGAFGICINDHIHSIYLHTFVPNLISATYIFPDTFIPIDVRPIVVEDGLENTIPTGGGGWAFADAHTFDQWVLLNPLDQPEQMGTVTLRGKARYRPNPNPDLNSNALLKSYV